MMKSFLRLFVFSCFILVTGCKDNTVIIPPNILPKEELVPLLADLRIAQASVTIYEYTDTLKYNLEDYKRKILEKRNVTDAKFDASMKFYAEHPVLLQQIYEEVVNELSRAEGELEKK